MNYRILSLSLTIPFMTIINYGQPGYMTSCWKGTVTLFYMTSGSNDGQTF